MSSPLDSHEYTTAKFDSEKAAATYSQKFIGGHKDAREQRCLLNALTDVAAGSKILDLPCGTGRLTTFLVGQGYNLVAADYSPHMVELATKRCLEQLGEEQTKERVTLLTADVLNCGFEDDSFDAVVSNRLFHHFSSSELRRKALAELARISRGPVIVSFFSSFAVDALTFRISNAIRGITPVDRIPIPEKEFRADVEAVGLRVVSVEGVRYGISPQTYVKAVPA
jgi:ubiquinone/menaquinone biosynthesis C-methylase UbiE